MFRQPASHPSSVARSVMGLARSVLTCLPLSFGLPAAALEVYVDADYSLNPSSAQSIELGLQTALAEAGFELGGQPVSIVRKDHRGNVKRSYRTMQSYVDSPDALVLFGGLHSPPYLAHRSYMNQNGVLALLPWSAAGPITRADPGDSNWIFRLSVDDFKSSEFFLRQTLDHGGCNSLALILLDTGWGRANEASLTRGAAARDVSLAGTFFFPSNLGAAAAGTLASNVAATGADCAIMLSNSSNGEMVVRALHENGVDLRLFSHWGIMGGRFAENVPHEMREALDLKVLQTCGLRQEERGNAVLRDALAGADQGFGRLSDVSAPTGFVHGYDLGRILIAASAQAANDPNWMGDISAKRAALRQALQSLEAPVDGILDTYFTPFRPYSAQDPDAHEAIGVDGLCMARFNAEGRLVDAP